MNIKQKASLILTDEMFCETYLVEVFGRGHLEPKIARINVWAEENDASFEEVLDKISEQFDSYEVLCPHHIRTTHHFEEGKR